MNGNPEIALIVARATNGAIGRDGKLPWHLPADLKRFKALTMGSPMVMGRKTFDSLPGLLPGRRHVVLTRDADWSAPGADVVHSIQDALAMGSGTLWVIGGAEIFELFAPLADRIELTEVLADIAGDTFMPDPRDSGGWREVASEEHQAEGDRPAYRFVTLERASESRP
jgi:dihydrofolate reductase